MRPSRMASLANWSARSFFVDTRMSRYPNQIVLFFFLGKPIKECLNYEYKIRAMTTIIWSDPDLFSRVITGDESWIFQYDPVKTKRQSKEWYTDKSRLRKLE